MWDAQEQYWKGYEWTKHLSGNTGQPTVNGGSSPNYAQNSSDSNHRWHHRGSGSGRFDATQSCAGLPNVNEMTWYVTGDPRWDADELWTTMGHLYKGGMWFKKKSVLLTEGHYNSNTAADGTDWRTNANSQYWPGSQTLPFAADAGNYFYLPTLGAYISGQLYNVGNMGYYWSSSAYPLGINRVYELAFDSNGNVYLNFLLDPSMGGLRVGGFE